jgi:hypothetical protein
MQSRTAYPEAKLLSEPSQNITYVRMGYSYSKLPEWAGVSKVVVKRRLHDEVKLQEIIDIIKCFSNIYVIIC